VSTAYKITSEPIVLLLFLFEEGTVPAAVGTELGFYPVTMTTTTPTSTGTAIHLKTHRGLQEWSGSIMDSELRLYSIDGRGDEIIPITCEERRYGFGSYSVTFQKMDEDGTLSIAVVQDGQFLKQVSTSAAYGVVSLTGEC
jgi:hypothetical protein